MWTRTPHWGQTPSDLQMDSDLRGLLGGPSQGRDRDGAPTRAEKSPPPLPARPERDRRSQTAVRSPCCGLRFPLLSCKHLETAFSDWDQPGSGPGSPGCVGKAGWGALMFEALTLGLEACSSTAGQGRRFCTSSRRSGFRN